MCNDENCDKKIQHFKREKYCDKKFQSFSTFQIYSGSLKTFENAFFNSIFKKNRAFNVLKLQCFTSFSKKV